MIGRPKKRSLTLRGHRTSVSLEDVFWKEFQKLAGARGVSVNELASEIDAARGVQSGLASAIRVYVVERLRDQAAATGNDDASTPSG